MPKLPNLRPMNTGKTVAELHEDPRIESYVGQNNPYRGLEDHGVPDKTQPEDFNGYEDMHSGEFYVDKNPPIDPIPVKIVNSGGKELRRFNTTQSTLDSSSAMIPRMIIGRREGRINLFIFNLSAATIWIGNNESIQPFMGYPILANSGLPAPLEIEDAVWGIAATGLTAQICVLEQYAVTER